MLLVWKCDERELERNLPCCAYEYVSNERPVPFLVAWSVRWGMESFLSQERANKDTERAVPWDQNGTVGTVANGSARLDEMMVGGTGIVADAPAVVSLSC